MFNVTALWGQKFLLCVAGFVQMEAPCGSSHRSLYLWLNMLILLPVCSLLADLESSEIAVGARRRIDIKPPSPHVYILEGVSGK